MKDLNVEHHQDICTILMSELEGWIKVWNKIMEANYEDGYTPGFKNGIYSSVYETAKRADCSMARVRIAFKRIYNKWIEDWLSERMNMPVPKYDAGSDGAKSISSVSGRTPNKSNLPAVIPGKSTTSSTYTYVRTPSPQEEAWKKLTEMADTAKREIIGDVQAVTENS